MATRTQTDKFAIFIFLLFTANSCISCAQQRKESNRLDIEQKLYGN